MLATLRTTFGLALAASATLLTIAGSAAPAQAAEFGAPRTAVIATNGIALDSVAGRAMVEAKVRRAAKAVCSADDQRDLAQVAAARACTANAIAAALPRVAELAAAAQANRTLMADTNAPTGSVRR